MPNQIVLVKDGPLTDELNKIIAQYDSITIVSLSHNYGLGYALNEGLMHCNYEIVARMDTDDIAKPNRFARQMSVLDKHSEIDIVGAWIDEFEDSITNVTSTRKVPENHESILKFAKSRNPINHPVVMFRKSAVISAGGYQDCPFFEDYYLWVRMLQNGAKFYNLQESLLCFRSSSEMFKRRGGWQYAKYEFKFQNRIRKSGFISFFRFGANVLLRFCTRIIPNSFRSRIYNNILRK